MTSKKMDRNMVIETAYEAIKDSLEWIDNYKSDGNGGRFLL